MVRKRGWHDAGPIAVAFLIYVLSAAGFVDWTAGWCAATRHLVPVIPLAAIAALAGATELARDRRGALIVLILGAMSTVNAILTIVLTPYFPFDFEARLAQLVLPSLTDGAGFPNLVGSVLGMPASVAVALTAATALAALLWALRYLVQGQRWLVLVVCLTVVAVQLIGYSWLGSRADANTEFMRAQVLERLGYTTLASRLEERLIGEMTLIEE